MSRYFDESRGDPKFAIILRDGAAVALFFIILLMAGYPPYHVWTQTLSGKADLRKAEWNRQILVQEAIAKEEAAKSWANAEVERAKGSAFANEILSKSLGGKEGYLRWLFIDNLEHMKGQVIYLPTEAGIPVLEASRLLKDNNN